MKKNLLLVVLLLFVIPCYVHAANVALIVKDANSLSEYHETEIRNILVNMGHDVTLVDNSTSINYQGYDLIVVAGRPKLETSLDSFVADLPVNEYPTVAIDYYYPDDWGWSTHMRGADANSIYISNAAHPIASGYTGTQNVYDSYFSNGKLIFTQTYETKLTQVAYYATQYSSVIAAAEKNTTMYNGNVTKNRVVFFGIPYSKYWNSVAENLFKNSVNWVLAGESLSSKKMDVDNDGTDEKALDSDSNMINGYENYTDPNDNTAVISLDCDDDGKIDYLIDVNNTGIYEKYWDPDNGLLTDIAKSGDYYLIDIDANGMPDKAYNGTLSVLQTLQYDVNNDGIEETILDVNGNGQTDVIDKVWDNGVYGLPDLAVNDITFSNSNPATGNTVTVTAMLDNDGYNANNFLVEFLVDNSVKESRTMNMTNVALNWSAVAGTHEIKIRLDNNNKIFESDETNNEKAKSMSVSSPGSGDSGTPTVTYEKRVQVTSTDSIDIEKDEEYSLIVLVKNTGNVNLNSVELRISGVPSAWITTPAQSNLPVGQEKSFTSTIKPASAGSYTLSLKVYSQNYLLNEKTISLSVSEKEVKEPNIMITDLMLPNISAGGSGAVSVSLANDGNDIGAVTVFLVLPDDWSVSPEEVMISLNPGEEKTVNFNIDLPDNAVDTSVEVHADYYSSGEIKTDTQTAELYMEQKAPLTGMATFVGSYILQIAVSVVVITAIVVFYFFGRESTTPWSSSIKLRYSIPRQRKFKNNKVRMRIVS